MTRSGSSAVAGSAFRVTGRVQGVGFRWWTQSQAEALELTGTVRNTADGAVEIQAWGSPAALATLERRLRVGPATARVERVEASALADSPPADFRVVG